VKHAKLTLFLEKSVSFTFQVVQIVTISFIITVPLPYLY